MFATRKFDLRQFPTKADQPAFVYILACANDSFYVGVTENLAIRFNNHDRGRGSRHTRKHGVVLMVAYWRCETRREALGWEIFWAPRLAKRQPSTYTVHDILGIFATHMELLRGFGRSPTATLLSEV